MRTLKRREQTIKILAPTITKGTVGGEVITWPGTATNVLADVQPISSMTQITEYGTRIDKMMLAIVKNSVTAEIGYGVWLAGENTANPPWRIISKAAWNDLTNLTLEKKA